MLKEMPKGYFLQTYDDCGFSGRMPHVPTDAYRYTFPEGSVNASLRDRTISHGMPDFRMFFHDLKLIPYILAVTYASEKEQPIPRVQSLYASDILIHGPYKLPEGSSQRILLPLPKEAIKNGQLELSFVRNEGPNAVVSVVELWAPTPSPEALTLEAIPSINGKIQVAVLNLACEGIPDVNVSVQKEGIAEVLEIIKTQENGKFELDASKWISPGEEDALEISATNEGLERKVRIDLSELYFIPPIFRPIPTQTGSELSLNGTWRICVKDLADIIPDQFDGSDWSDFQVPGQWGQQGFNVPGDQTVCMAKEFTIPQNWSGNRQFIRFDAIHGGATYWLNGHLLGTSENLFTPVEFEISGFANIGGKNQLVIKIKHDTPSELASYSSGYAFHSLGGIDRSIRLFSLPKAHISRFYVETDLDSSYEDGELTLNFEIDNVMASETAEAILAVELQSPEGNIVDLIDPKMELKIPAGEMRKFSKSFEVEKPSKWSAEKPSLYGMVVRLYSNDGFLEQITREVGFRNIQVSGSELLLNGKPIKLFGVNRHEVDPFSGRADTAKHAYQDAQLFKDANFNYIRTSHYPPTQEFLDACDQIGIYVECEAPFCWTRGRGENDPSKTKGFLTATSAMLEAHRDHPSIIIWSLANESGQIFNGNDRLDLNFQATLDFCHNQDATRPVVFNNEWNRDGKACDIAILHYPPLDLGSCPFIADDPRPVLMDEYFPPQTFTFEKELYLNPGLDIVNWSTNQNFRGSIWNKMYNDPRVLGGAIWAGVDEEFFFSDGSVKGYGVWGFIDVWRRKKSLWWDAKRIFSPIWIPTRQVFPVGESVKIPIENRYSFTDLSELTIQWQIDSEKGNIYSNLPAGSSGELEIPIPDQIEAGSLLILRFLDSHNNLVTAHGVQLGERKPIIIPEANAGCPIIEENERQLMIKGEDFAFTIDRNTRKVILSFGPGLLRLPLLFVARQESKNVFNPGGLEYAQFPVDGKRTIDGIHFSSKANALEIVIREHFKDFVGSVSILLDKSGFAELSFDYIYSGEAFSMSEFGLQIPMDDRYQGIWWKRQTEWDVYPDDHIGRSEGEAKTHRSPENLGLIPRPIKPDHPWHLDENEFGTRDFRAAKYNIYEAKIFADDGSGIQLFSNGTTDVRANLAEKGVLLNLLVSPIQVGRDNQMGYPVRTVKSGEHLTGRFYIKLLGMVHK